SRIFGQNWSGRRWWRPSCLPYPPWPTPTGWSRWTTLRPFSACCPELSWRGKKSPGLRGAGRGENGWTVGKLGDKEPSSTNPTRVRPVGSGGFPTKNVALAPHPAANPLPIEKSGFPQLYDSGTKQSPHWGISSHQTWPRFGGAF